MVENIIKADKVMYRQCKRFPYQEVMWVVAGHYLRKRLWGVKCKICQCPDCSRKSVLSEYMFNKYASNKTIGQAGGPTDSGRGMTSWEFQTSQLCEESVCCWAEKSSRNPTQTCMVLVVLARWLRKPLVSFTGLFTSKTKTSSPLMKHTQMLILLSCIS